MKKFFNPKFILQLLIVCGVTFGGLEAGLATNVTQALTLAVFSAVITTTLLFWERRVGVAFIGVALLVGCKAMTLRQMLTGTELDIILFLVGMMIIVGVLKDLGFLTWVIQVIISRNKMTGVSFTAILCVLSAVMASVVDEVSSIVVVLALVFQVCETLKLRPHPFVLIAVMSTNIGSSATMLGNPVGIFIGNKAGFTFSQFLVGATPVAFAALVCTFLITLFWFRKDIHAMSEAMASHRKMGLSPTAKIPYKAGLVVLLTTVIVIAFHHQIEGLLGLEGADNHNAFLIMTPLVVAGILMILRPARAPLRGERRGVVDAALLHASLLHFRIAQHQRHHGQPCQDSHAARKGWPHRNDPVCGGDLLAWICLRGQHRVRGGLHSGGAGADEDVVGILRPLVGAALRRLLWR